MAKKKLPWFRLYGEFAYDPKIQSLHETLQRRYVMLLCLKCNGELPGLDDDQVSWALRITNEELVETKKKFIELGLIDENMEITKWSERQYVSDSSSARVAKYRSNKKETLRGRFSNKNKKLQKRSASVSVSESESESKSKEPKGSKKDIDILSDYILSTLGIPISDKGRTEELIKEFTLEVMIKCVDRMKIYFDTCKKNKWKEYMIGKHWRNLYEKINYFLSNEDLKNKLEEAERSNNKKGGFFKSNSSMPKSTRTEWQKAHDYDEGVVNMKNYGVEGIKDRIKEYKEHPEELGDVELKRIAVWEKELADNEEAF